MNVKIRFQNTLKDISTDSKEIADKKRKVAYAIINTRKAGSYELLKHFISLVLGPDGSKKLNIGRKGPDKKSPL